MFMLIKTQLMGNRKIVDLQYVCFLHDGSLFSRVNQILISTICCKPFSSRTSKLLGDQRSYSVKRLSEFRFFLGLDIFLGV
ncbi:hypothetical protein P5673_009024 [Acropora cervicornis]|uniref:Uncharacterized protein n=1 Tax=Acropora cervicornis TaxID=6130 RepID=A0AAD9VAD9_ACRCE|nr:hypothetical protein P5673_009024 [Acropora cervicornis]